MNNYTMTCNCYIPPVRDKIAVQAATLDEAWDKAKKKFCRKHKAKPDDVSITAIYRH